MDQTLYSQLTHLYTNIAEKICVEAQPRGTDFITTQLWLFKENVLYKTDLRGIHFIPSHSVFRKQITVL